MSQRLKIALIGLSAVALTATAAVPHQHAHSSLAEETSSCPLWQMHVGFSATLPAMAAVVVPLGWIAWTAIHPLAVPPRRLAARCSSPRAPPALS